MKRYMILFLILVLTVKLTSCGQPAGETVKSGSGTDTAVTWQEQYDLGIRYLSEGNYQEAVIAFTAAIEIDPKQAPAYVGRGDAYILSNETEENLSAAQADYEKAIELNDALAGAYLGLANVYIQRRDYDGALKILRDGLVRIEANEDLSNKIAEIESLLNYEESRSEITVLTKQEITMNTDEWGKYSSEKTFSLGYSIYQYDNWGYMIHSESWFNSYNFETDQLERVKTSSTDWIYNPEKDRWTEKYEHRYGPQNGIIELQQYSPGTHHYSSGLNGEVSITADPYPAGIPGIVYNPSYSEKGAGYEWYSAKYTYDENGNAIVIKSYSKDGKLLGTCTLEYEVI